MDGWNVVCLFMYKTLSVKARLYESRGNAFNPHLLQVTKSVS